MTASTSRNKIPPFRPPLPLFFCLFFVFFPLEVLEDAGRFPEADLRLFPAGFFADLEESRLPEAVLPDGVFPDVLRLPDVLRPDAVFPDVLRLRAVLLPDAVFPSLRLTDPALSRSGQYPSSYSFFLLVIRLPDVLPGLSDTYPSA